MARDGDQAESVTLTIEPLDRPVRLDRYLAEHPSLTLSRTKIQKLIGQGAIKVDALVVPAKHPLSGGETVTIERSLEPEPAPLTAENIPLDVIFEDDHLVVVNKPAGMVTHPAPGNYSGTLVNALAYHFATLAGEAGADRPGIVHRLDKNTSGLLVIARDDLTYRKLQSAIQAREVHRAYTALICGHVKEPKGRIDQPIGRSVRDRKKMAVTTKGSREAVTEYELTRRYHSFDLLQARLLTGRTHQIRVHFAHLGHPVFGDPEYGGRRKWVKGMFAPERPLALELLDLLPRQALHASQLAFTHPMTGEKLEFEAPLPEDFAAVLDLLDQREQG